MPVFWRSWLIIWCLGVGLFGLVLAGGAFEATSAPVRWILSTLQGGGDLAFDPVLRFSLAVMGCVTLGWAATMLVIMLAIFGAGEAARPIWAGLTTGVLVWFVTDSGLSLATGFGLNVIPNVVVVAGYVIAIVGSGAMRKTRGSATSQA